MVLRQHLETDRQVSLERRGGSGDMGHKTLYQQIDDHSTALGEQKSQQSSAGWM